MPIGIEVQLNDDAGDPLADLTGITACWWDVVDPADFSRPAGKASGLALDSYGSLTLDLSAVSLLANGQSGFLLLHKGAVSHQDSPIFASRMEVETISSGNALEPVDPWVRPADWLSLPALTTSDEKFVGLFAVFQGGSNYVALRVSGAYTVDWGDGTSPENVASATTAEHEYDYSTISSDTQCSRGYRQVVITITMQSGQSFTSLDLQRRHSALSGTRGVGWLDIAFAGASLSTFTSGLSGNAVMSLLERVVSPINVITNFTYMFYNYLTLQSVDLHTSSGTNFSDMFYACSALRSANLSDTSSGTSFGNMFYACRSLQSIPPFDLSSGTSFGTMFHGCFSLQSIPPLDLSSGTSFGSMFLDCFSLQSVPPLDLSSGTNLTSMFQGCRSLHSVGALDTSGATNFAYMFNGCPALQSLPALDFSNGTEFFYVVQDDPSLSRSEATGCKVNISYSNCKLSAAALNEIFTNLATVSSKTITITGNPGASTCDKTIAENKGWTVTV